MFLCRQNYPCYQSLRRAAGADPPDTLELVQRSEQGTPSEHTIPILALCQGETPSANWSLVHLTVKFCNITCKASAAVADGGSRVKIHPAAVAPWDKADARGTSAVPRSGRYMAATRGHRPSESGRPVAAPWQRKQPLFHNPVASLADGLRRAVSYNKIVTSELPNTRKMSGSV